MAASPTDAQAPAFCNHKLCQNVGGGVKGGGGCVVTIGAVCTSPIGQSRVSAGGSAIVTSMGVKYKAVSPLAGMI
jgi:hypothetical protein